jgi:hypothetical protein
MCQIYCDFQKFVDFRPIRDIENPTPSKNRFDDNFRVQLPITPFSVNISIEISAPCIEPSQRPKECSSKPLFKPTHLKQRSQFTHNSSIGQVKKMAQKKRGFGIIVRPKLKKQSRPRALTQKMVELESSPVILQARIVHLEFRLL